MVRSSSLKLRPALATAVLAIAPAFPAASTEVGATMTISAEVVPSCNLAAGAMAFGAFQADDNGAAAKAAITLECTPGTAYAVTMDQGLHGSRRMADIRGEAFLDYEIF